MGRDDDRGESRPAGPSGIPPADHLRTQGLRLLRMNLLGQVSIETYLPDGAELSLKPIDMLFRIDDHLFEPTTGREVSDLCAMGNPVAKHFRILTLEGQIGFQQLRDFLASGDGVQAIHLRSPPQVQDMIDQARGMADLFLGQVTKMLVESTIPPMLTRGRMQEVLMHRRELSDQYLIQDLEDALFRFHAYPRYNAGTALA